MPEIEARPSLAGMYSWLSERAAEPPEAQLLAAILDQVPIGVTIWQLEDPDDVQSFRLVAANQSAARLTGVPVPALLGKTMPQLFPRLLETEMPARWAQVVGTGQAMDQGEFEYAGQGVFSVTAFPLPGNRVGTALLDARPRKEIQRLLESERERFEVTLSSIGDAVIATDVQGRITFLNPAAAALTGWEVQQALGRDVGEVFVIVQAHTRRPVENPVIRVLREGLVVGLANHTVLVSRGGQDIPIDDSGAPIRDASGRMIGVVLVFRDIRERVRAEAAQRQAYEDLQQARRQLEAVLDGVADGIVGYDRQGRLVYANSNAARLLGYPSVQALLDAPIEHTRERFEILDEYGRPMPSGQLPHARVLQGEPQAEALIRYRVRASGEEKWSFIRAAPVRDSEGQIQFIIDIFHDVTDARRAELEHLQLAAIVQSSEDAIIGKDLEGIITSWNPGAERMFGYSPAEAVGRSITMIFPSDRQNESRDIMRRLRRGERIEQYETERVRQDGSRLDVSVSISPLRDHRGRIVGAADITRDITDRRRRERADHFLAEASAALSSSLDYETTLRSVARLAVPALADWCTVDLLDESGRIRRLAVAHVDPDRVRWAYELERRYPADPGASRGVAHVIRTGQPELEPDLTTVIAEAAMLDPEYEHILLELGLKSYLCVPLIARGWPIGAISFISTEPGTGRPGSGRVYGPADLALAEELARRAAMAIDNARLYRSERLARQATERSAGRMARLQRITAALAEALTPDAAAQTTLREGLAAFGADAGSIYAFDEDGETLRALGYTGYPESDDPRYRRVSLATPGPLQDAIRAGEIVAAESAGEMLDRWPHLAEAQARSGDVATIAAPLLNDRRPIGVLYMAFRQPRRFDDADRTFLSTLARQCAQALERARLYQAEQAARRRSEFLDRVSRELAASLDMQATLNQLCALAVPEFADYCGVYLLEDGRLGMASVAHRDPAKAGLLSEWWQSVPQSLDAEVAVLRVVRTGIAERLPDVPQQVPEPFLRTARQVELLRQLAPRSGLVVPLTVRSRQIGAMSFVRTASADGRWPPERNYTQEDLALAEEVGRRAAVAIDNALLYAEAQRAIQLRNQFMTVASHELKTPLTSILGFTQVLSARLERSGNLAERDRRALQILQRQGQQLNRLIGGLLDFSRIQAGRLELERAPLEIGALVRRTVDEALPDDRDHPIECRTPAEPLMVDGDAARLEQVIQNLLRNAVKYSPAGSPIQVRVERRDGAVEIAVRDRGIGIPAEALPHIFERFYRAANADSMHIGGLGIGLFVVRDIVTLHGGTVEVVSQEGQGSTFTVRLPLIRSAEAQDESNPQLYPWDKK